jgi:imidazolonepropionase-like amidohydrolase
MFIKTLKLAICGGLLLGCTHLASAAESLAFIGARIFDGTAAAVLEDGVIVTEDGRITAIGPRGSVAIPEQARQIDVAGKTIMPGLINTHGHVGGVRGLESGHYTEENLLRQLRLYARYGVTTVNSLGDDGPEGFVLRDRQQNAELDHARLLLTGPVLSPDTPAEAVLEVDKAAQNKPAFIKIRVDDNLGRTEKMLAAVAQAISDRADQLDIPLAVHTYYLQDTKDLLRGGADFVAHSVRDVHIDQEFIDLIKARDVCYTPTLTREVSTFVYEHEVGFFSDPFFLNEVDQAIIETLREPARQQRMSQNAAAQQYKASLAIAMTNLKLLADAGANIAMGTDSGPVARFQGYFEHLEMWMMADAGLSPLQILQSATSVAAACLNLPDVGTLAAGKWADLLILDKNPLDDIRNTRTISEVWIGGKQIPRVGL